MVLCKYFQQGYCRFGSKCANEHFDIKQVIKSDVEAALNGNQWPLSCFGPFKDKPCLPNFIEDQSFEEIRFLCYQSKQKNFFDQFHQQFTKEVLDAKNKLKAVLQLTPDVLDIVTKVYDTPVDTANGAVKTSNPFGMTGSGSATTESSSSIFGKTAAAAAPGIAPFGGGFGANSGGNIFSNNNTSGAAAFGGGLFAGGSTFGNAGTAQNSIFGQTATPTNTAILGGGVAQTSGFGQTNQGIAAAGGGIFSQQTNAAPAAGLFAQPTQQPTSMGIFAQAAQQTAPGFGIQPQTQPGLFGQAGQQQLSGNIFAQQQPQQMQTLGTAPAAGGGLFAAAAAESQNVFQQQQQSTNIFAQQNQNTSAASFFQPTFMQPAQTAAPAAPPPGVGNSSIYSRLEDLSADEIEAFKADQFTMGKIPFSPPPRELVN